VSEKGGTQSSIQAITLPDARALTREMFYAERDDRTTRTAVVQTSPFLVGVVLPGPLTESAAGQTGLIWLCSMLRRMGQSLSTTVIIADKSAPSAAYRGLLRTDRGTSTLNDALEAELSGADPFGSILWRELNSADAFADLEMIISIGDDLSTRPTSSNYRQLTVNADGWVASVEYDTSRLSRIEEAASRPKSAFDGATATIVIAAAFGAAAVYRELRSLSPPPSGDQQSVPIDYWYSIDSGAVTVDPLEGIAWRENGSSEPERLPWSEFTGKRVDLVDGLLIVSAGGIGNNAAQILSGSFVNPTRVAIIDPDFVDVSNLNRLVGVSVSDVTRSKAVTSATPLIGTGFNVEAVPATYESWANAMRTAKEEDFGQAALVGVDQIVSRLHVQADWPPLLINGGTSGTGWNVSSHPRGCGGCLGCGLGGTAQTYAESRRAVGCAAGANLAVPSVAQPPDPSYPFSSVSAAAAMVALLIHHSFAIASGDHLHGTRRALNGLSPQFAVVGATKRHPLCLLLCSDPSLDVFFSGRCTAA
jgi:hypothetical protein